MVASPGLSVCREVSKFRVNLLKGKHHSHFAEIDLVVFSSFGDSREEGVICTEELHGTHHREGCHHGEADDTGDDSRPGLVLCLVIEGELHLLAEYIKAS